MAEKEYAETTQQLQLKHVNSRHRSMMRCIIAGVKPSELCTQFGLTENRMSIIVHSPLFQEELKKMELEVQGEFVTNEGGKTQSMVRGLFAEEALASLDKLVALRDGAQSERVQQLSAIEILDRAGYKATEKIDATIALDANEGLVNALAEAVKVMRTEKKDEPK